MRWQAGAVAFGVAGALANLKRKGRAAARGLRRGMKKWAGMVASLSQAQVPWLTGELARSLVIDVQDNPPSIQLKYTARHAAIVHETPRPPSSNGKWKYLEDPFKQLVPQLEAVVGLEIRKEMRAA